MLSGEAKTVLSVSCAGAGRTSCMREGPGLCNWRVRKVHGHKFRWRVDVVVGGSGNLILIVSTFLLP